MKTTHSRYAHSFHRHVLQFMDAKNLWPLSSPKRAWVALSGGMDSMCLLHLLVALRKERELDLVAVNVDHLSGAWSVQARDFCREQCASLEVPFVSYPLPSRFVGVGSNREHLWRQGRRVILGGLGKSGGRVYQGHHLNDSFEWYLLGQLKSSSKKIPGISLCHGPFCRPFLCVSRPQIESYAREKQISFITDPSNKEMSLERNFLRHSMEGWQQVFPKYLKHYVLRQNASLREGGSRFYRYQDAFGGWIYWSWQGDGGGANLREDLLTGIYDMSHKGRGSLSKEVDKLLVAVQKRDKLGPMIFTGGVFAYWEPPMIYLLSEGGQRERAWALKKMSLVEKTYDGWQELRDHYHRFPYHLTLPLFLPGGEKSLKIPANHPLYAPLIRDFGSRGVWISPLRLLQRMRGVSSWPLRVREYTYPVDVSMMRR